MSSSWCWVVYLFQPSCPVRPRSGWKLSNGNYLYDKDYDDVDHDRRKGSLGRHLFLRWLLRAHPRNKKPLASYNRRGTIPTTSCTTVPHQSRPLSLQQRLENYLVQASVPRDDQLDFLQRARRYRQQGMLPVQCEQVLIEWYHSYCQALVESFHNNHHHFCHEPNREETTQSTSTSTSSSMAKDPAWFTEVMFQVLLELVRRCCQQKYIFEPFHRSIRQPFDYLEFGLDFARPVIHLAQSTVWNARHFTDTIPQQLQRGDNVILFSNHQSEGDPHAIHVVLENLGQSQLAYAMIFMAGDRVREDPVAMPFSMGRNLLTVYSKRHIDDYPEKKAEKLQHNKKTIQKMQQLLQQGGNIIWLAPSGGRDRRDMAGLVRVADFIPESLELMRFVATQVKPAVHFYPMALKTWDLLPPPDHIQVALGEKRVVRYVPVGIAIGDPIEETEWSLFHTTANKQLQREQRARYFHGKVKQLYEQQLRGLDQ
jgi:glycerol-3-phosphate O-acyltransferase